jgi:hypothetical protein
MSTFKLSRRDARGGQLPKRPYRAIDGVSVSTNSAFRLSSRGSYRPLFGKRPRHSALVYRGIGRPLNAAITTLAWTKVSLILLIIIATVVVSEWVSAKVRHTII